MRTLILIACVALVSACAAPHAVKVRCDRHLVPINPAGWTLAGKPPPGSATKEAAKEAAKDAPGSRAP